MLQLSRWELLGYDEICFHWGGNVLGPKFVAYIAKVENAKVKKLATELC